MYRAIFPLRRQLAAIAEHLQGAGPAQALGGVQQGLQVGVLLGQAAAPAQPAAGVIQGVQIGGEHAVPGFVPDAGDQRADVKAVHLFIDLFGQG